MRRHGWHLRREAGRLILARRWPARLDAVAEATFPPLRQAALAHEIRKDLWRRMRGRRGLSPVIVIDGLSEGTLRVTAGLRSDVGPVPAAVAAMLDALLDDPVLRRRWCAHARVRAA